MIDYEKLKEAHELMLILSNNNGCSLRLTFCDGKFWKYFLQINDKKDIFEFNCIDDLITKLKELAQTKPKYALGDIVWLYDYSINEIQSFKIDAITLKTFKYSGNCIEDGFAYEEIAEKDIYPSREALIDAQIEYWKGLKQDEIVPVEESQESKICPECGALADYLHICSYSTDSNSNKDSCDHIYAGGGSGHDLSQMSMKCSKCGKNFGGVIHKANPACEHEPTTEYYLAYPYKKPNKCKKCGEFYK
ncbi:TPA: hypothetical protein I8Z16_001725 [Legionella pneumophila]|nr:hypothetical protein [Legionella pneumophila]